jgi:hypothetical protein
MRTSKHKGKVVPVHVLKACRVGWVMALLILNLCARWRGLVNITCRPLDCQDRTLVPNEWEAGWAPEPVWMIWRR